MHFTKYKSITLLTGSMLLETVAFAYVCSAFLYLAGLSPVGFAIPLGFVLSIITTFSFSDRRALLAATFLTAIVMIAAIVLGTWIFDYSFDGNYYHQEIITALCQGWNPYRNTMGMTGLMMWDYHYAKALEIVAADISAITGKLESGKAVNLILAAATTLLSYYFLRRCLRFKSVKHSLIMAALIIFNPVVVCQIFTYYIDYALYLYIINTIIASVIIAEDRYKPFGFLLLTSTMILAIGTKFNAFFMEGICIACIIIAFYIYGKKKILKPFIITVIFIGLFSALLVAYHPYVTNTLLNGNPFYPLLGNPDVDIMTKTTPPEFLGANRFVNFVRSIFSIAPPSFDSRKGGFGPLFGLIFIISLITTVLSIRRRRSIGPLEYTVICVILSCFIFEQSWWARYNPQLWMVVPLCYLQILSLCDKHLNAFTSLFIISVALDLLPCIANTIRLSGMTITERKALFSTLKGDSVYLHNPKIHWERQLNENGITVVYSEGIDKDKTDTLYVYGYKSELYHFPYVLVSREKFEAVDSILSKSPLHRISRSIKPD